MSKVYSRRDVTVFPHSSDKHRPAGITICSLKQPPLIHSTCLQCKRLHRTALIMESREPPLPPPVIARQLLLLLPYMHLPTVDHK